MTVDDATRTDPGRRRRRPAHRPPQPPPPAPDRRAPAAAAQHRHHRHGLAGRRGRAGVLSVVAMSFGSCRAGSSTRSTPRSSGRSPGSAPSGSPTSPTAIDRVGSGWTITVIGFALLVCARRAAAVAAPLHVHRRHVVIEIIADVHLPLVRSARGPYDVTIIGRWDGWSFFAAPVAVVALLGVGDHLHAGRRRRGRRIAKAVTAVAVVGLRAAASSTWRRSTRPTSSSA